MCVGMSKDRERFNCLILKEKYIVSLSCLRIILSSDSHLSLNK